MADGAGEDGGSASKRRRQTQEREVRYFAVDEVLCSRCGLRGHLSWACPEPEPELRCFICGKPGHLSKDCQREVCYNCGETGHKSRECPRRRDDRGSSDGRMARIRSEEKEKRRRKFEPRPIPLKCYVCNGDSHLDCSLSRPYPAKLSCFNCGKTGHSGLNCPTPNMDVTLRGVNRILRDDDFDSGGGRGRKRRRSTASDRPERQRELAQQMYDRLDDVLTDWGYGARRTSRAQSWSGRPPRSRARRW